MDEMVIKTPGMTGVIGWILKRLLKKKFGCDINIQLNELYFENSNGKVKIHADVNAETNSENLMKIVKSIGSD